ncbi:MAG: hypothetical protein P8Z80_14510 [Pseudolabrys sp.]
MSILLYVVGAITLAIGTLATGYGTTINEFSFGNTLIVAGTTGMVGGLIVVGLGAVVAHLQHLADTVATRAPLRPNRPPETVAAGHASPLPRAAGVAEPGEVPPVESPPPVPVAAAAGEPLAAAPSLPNPDVPPMAAFPEAPEEASVSPPPPFRAPPPVAEPAEAALPPPPPSGNGAEGGALAFEPEPEPEPEPLPAWLSPPRMPEPPQPLEPANFESVWPPVKERAGDQPMAGDNAPDVRRETHEEPAPAPAAAAEPATESEPPAERRSVAILKSGVVDGMGYTLYVDGSIEAELPQGTLRFASINDLREHLEKTS